MARQLSSIRLSYRSHSSVADLRLIGPAVKLMYEHYGIDPSALKPTGPKNNFLKSDLLSFINERQLKPKPPSPAPTPTVASTAAVDTEQTPTPSTKQATRSKVQKGPVPSTPPNYVDIPLSNMRLTIANRLSTSKNTIPHSYQSTSVVVNNLLALRKRLAKAGTKVSLNDFIIKAAGSALRRVPQINVQWKNEKIVRLENVDVSVAVATPNGLITPIIFAADQLGVNEISTRLRELAAHAHENKLKLHEFQGGSFTVSNLGMYDIESFTAIINPPQAAILTIGGLRMELNEFDRPENRFEMTLCYDARAITDRDAQNFLRVLRALLLEPDVLASGPTEEEEMIDLF